MIFGVSSDMAVKKRPSPFTVIFAGAWWRLFGSRRAAETLLKAMSDDDEQNRMLAGMWLLKAPRRCCELIASKVSAGELSAPIIRLLPDIGSAQAREMLDEIASGAPSEISDTARQCIELMNRTDALEEDGA